VLPEVSRRRAHADGGQAALAKQLGSSQSRVAKIEAADKTVSLDLRMRSLLSIGATPKDIAKLIKAAEAAYGPAFAAAAPKACTRRRRLQAVLDRAGPD